MPPYGVRFCRDSGRPMDARKAPSGRGLPRERVGEPAKLWRFCKVGNFIQLSHPRFGD